MKQTYFSTRAHGEHADACNGYGLGYDFTKRHCREFLTANHRAARGSIPAGYVFTWSVALVLYFGNI